MSNTSQTYLDLITSEHKGQPDFTAMVAAVVAPMVQVQALLTAMMGDSTTRGLFDLNTPPVGNQLVIIGRWVGVSRYLEVPVAGVFFTWDDTPDTGWDSGIWQSPINDEVLTVLPDDVYLTLILAKIAANNWDGTTEGAYSIWEEVFPDLNILIQDNQNMSFVLGVQGRPLDALTEALLTQGILPLRPEGVQITEYIIGIDTGPLFGFDIGNSFIEGWDIGSWGKIVIP